VSEDQGGQLVAAEPAELARPDPLLAGTFAVYQAPDGGIVLVTEIPGRGVERRVVPGKVIRLATSGVGAKMFGSLFGGA
jgi:hypothetical protein